MGRESRARRTTQRAAEWAIEAAHRVGTGERTPGAFRVRARLARRALCCAHRDRAGAAANHRLPAHLLAVDQGHYHRRGRARGHPHRGRPRAVQGTAERQDRAAASRRAPSACSKTASCCGWTEDDDRRSTDDADSRTPAHAGARQGTQRAGPCAASASRSSSSPKAWRHCSSAGRTATRPPAAATCRG